MPHPIDLFVFWIQRVSFWRSLQGLQGYMVGENGFWTSALYNYAVQKKLFSTQRGAVLRIVITYRTVSTSAVLVLASVPPVDLSAEKRKETFQLRKELTCLTNLKEIACAKEDIRKDGRRRLVEKWQTRWHGNQSDGLSHAPV